MCKKYFGDEAISKVDAIYNETLENAEHTLVSTIDEAVKHYHVLMDEFKVADGLEEAMKMLRAANKYIDETAPWVLAKDESKKNVLKNVLYNLLEAIRIGSVLLEPAIPASAKKVYDAIHTQNVNFSDLVFGKEESYSVTPTEVLFQRLDVNKVMEEVLKKEEAKKKDSTPVVEAAPQKAEITIDDFDKLDLVMGEIISAEKHPKADKLLVFKVNIGGEVRQIVSGIAKWYKPEDTVGKKVVVVRNLKPVKLRGVESQGMLLCASDAQDENLELVTSNLNPGDIVR